MQNQTSYISPIANGQLPIANSPCAERTRLPWLDFASGIMILWMIVYHAIYFSWSYALGDISEATNLMQIPSGVRAFLNDGKLEILNPCVAFPWLHFFMPWFFYKSGQFFTKRSVKDLWKKDSCKLLKTFVIWSLVGYMFYLFIGMFDGYLTLRNSTYSIVRGLFLRGQVPINTPCWFLLTLFGVRFVANNLLPEREDKYATWKILSIVAVGYVVSYLTYRFNHRLLPYWVANGAAGLSFFALGYAMRDWEQKWIVLISSVVVCVVGSIIGCPIVDMFPNKLVNGDYFLWIPFSLCAIIIFNTLCKFVCRYIRIKPVELIGKNAMIIYVTHILVLTLVVEFLPITRLSTNLVIALIIMAYLLVLPILCWFKNNILNS